MTAPDLPAAARTLLKQLGELVPAWSINGPRHATGPCAFGGLSEETDGEGKRKRTQTVEQVDSVLIRAYHADGRALVALWVRRPGVKLSSKQLGVKWRRVLTLALASRNGMPIEVLCFAATVARWPHWVPREWALDMAWRGRTTDEHVPHKLATKTGTASTTRLTAYVVAPDHAAALAAVTEPKESEAA